MHIPHFHIQQAEPVDLISVPDTTTMERYAYLAGPMTDVPELNRPFFIRMAMMLRRAGWFIENPAEYDIARGVVTEEQSQVLRADLLREDFELIVTKCKVIILLPGWHLSEGARAEFLVATLSGRPAFEIVKNGAKRPQGTSSEMIQLQTGYSLAPVILKPEVRLV